jgi:hypothetical protein
MKRIVKKLSFPIIGFLSLMWFLIRVIPKPSRAAYPCMRTTAPIASSFVLYLVGLASSALLFKKARKYLYEAKYILFSVTLIVAVILGATSWLQNNMKALAINYQSSLEDPNTPMGEGKGIYPGRVVWIYEPDATDEDCRNTNGDYWYLDSNTDQEVVDKMVSDALQMLTGKKTDADAWDALFRYFNQNHDKGDVGYTAGEKFAIKINLNGENNYPQDPNINTSPQICYTVLNQLINVVGVAQADIHIGDSNISFDDPHWNKCHSAFPDVKYWGQGGGRTSVVRSSEKVLFASDGGASDWLPQSFLDAAYLINIPIFKKHHRAGISITSKNHFGSIAPFNGGAWHWHYSLPCPEGGADVSNGEYGVYRCFVDFMGHKDIGGKTVLNLVDGIWGSINWGHPPIKWRMAPFNNDWPSSVFASQDPVALQSVMFDFLYEEFDLDHPTEGDYDPRDNHGPFPHYSASDDFLHQAADSDNWPSGFTYDPEKDGTALPKSLGVHEHWNNATDKQYTRNLGTGNGIELVSNMNTSGVVAEKPDANAVVKDFILHQNYPNPFNASTTIWYELPAEAWVNLTIFNTTGQKVRTLLAGHQSAGIYSSVWDGSLRDGSTAPSGVYFYQIVVRDNTQTFKQVKKMTLSK